MSSFKDYLSCRPTELSEDDVLLCESRYIESEKMMKKFKGLKRFSYSSKVVEDEIFYFRSNRALIRIIDGIKDGCSQQEVANKLFFVLDIEIN